MVGVRVELGWEVHTTDADGRTVEFEGPCGPDEVFVRRDDALYGPVALRFELRIEGVLDGRIIGMRRRLVEDGERRWLLPPERLAEAPFDLLNPLFLDLDGAELLGRWQAFAERARTGCTGELDVDAIGLAELEAPVAASWPLPAVDWLERRTHRMERLLQLRAPAILVGHELRMAAVRLRHLCALAT